MSEEQKVEKRAKGDKGSKKAKEHKVEKVKSDAFSLLADAKAVDPALSSLFSKPAPTVPRPQVASVVANKSRAADVQDAGNDESDDGGGVQIPSQPDEDRTERRKRKRKAADEELEDAYMQKLAREDDKDAEKAAAERASKRHKIAPLKQAGDASDDEAAHDSEDGNAESGSDMDVDEDDDDGAASPPPKHETQETPDVELSKANRTVFLGNVSTTAISSKADRKTLDKHLASFFDQLPAPKEGEPKHSIESLRFRSTPYAPAIPKKAAYARKEVVDATTKSTNAYVIYSTAALAREAAKRLNGTSVLDRHLRVDEVAHPAKVDNKRCVFVGNLGFVDDESNIQAANEEDGREVRKRGKEPADVEEGLWRTFAKCGKVECVRVIRDSTTRPPCIRVAFSMTTESAVIRAGRGHATRQQAG